jgi:xylan 1,4-beta-xylosidase
MKYRLTVNAAIILMLISNISLSQEQKRLTYCNPVDIDYKYNFEQLNEKISYRSGADPVIVNHQGEYYMFVTISGGYWHSKDLVHWDFIIPSMWPMEDICAPAALSVKDTLFLFQSTFEIRPIFYTTTPWNGQLKFYNRWLPKLPGAKGPWDPDIFYDEDTGRWFMYSGSSNVYPIYGIELDHSRHLTYKGEAEKFIYLDRHKHGWERFGPDHSDYRKPFIEGAWMTKHNGKYYLQYAAPGTEYNVYANGVYVGDDPLGPFTYAPYNPVSYKPGGFMAGAGHGNTFQDKYGNYWNTGTPWVAVNWNFERRISMFPAGFDQDGQMFSITRFGDFPQYIPDSPVDNKKSLFTGWMLLSYKKPCQASSGKDNMPASNIVDENPRTFWVAAQNKPGEWLTIDLGKVYDVKAVQVNYTDYHSDIFVNDSTVRTQFRIYGSSDNKNWELIADLSKEKRDHPNAYVPINQAVSCRYIKYDHVYVASPELAISDIRVFGNGSGTKPSTPSGLMADRKGDRRDAEITWDPVPGAVGYNILWGLKPDKLYETYQVWADHGNTLEIRALTKDQSYYFAIEAFDENGVSPISEPVYCK